MSHVAPCSHSQPFGTAFRAYSGQAVDIQEATSEPAWARQTGVQKRAKPTAIPENLFVHQTALGSSQERTTAAVDLSICAPYSRAMGVSKAFIWFTQHPQEAKRYAGKHVAIVDDGIAAVADSSWQAYQKAKKKHPDKEPALTYIPKGDFLIL